MITISISVILLQLFIVIIQVIIATESYIKNNYLVASIASFGLGISVMAMYSFCNP
jgi:hypothetical protein